MVEVWDKEVEEIQIQILVGETVRALVEEMAEAKVQIERHRL